jgi:hypothetical protein
MSAGQHLIDVHDHHRSELAQVRDVLRRVREGAADVGDARDLQLDRVLVRMGAHPGEHEAVAQAIDALADALLDHLDEEAQLVGPLDRWGFS